MSQPTIKVRISAHPIVEFDEPQPLVEVVREETIVNSAPSITKAVTEFQRSYRGVKLGKIMVVRI